MENWDAKVSNPPVTGRESDNKKKRKRVTHTCSSCRSRKIKCDQGRPCSACIKKRIPSHLCIYEDSPFLPSPEIARDPQEAIMLLMEENKRLKRQLDQMKKAALLPPSSNNNNNNNNRTSINSNGNANLNKKVKRHESLTVKKNRITFNGPTNWKALLNRENEYKEMIDTAKAFVANAKKEWRLENKIKKVTNDEYKDIQTSTPDLLLKSLSQYLPDYYTVREYLNIYVKSYWYSSMPVVDAEMLFNDFHELFQKEFDGSNKVKFHIRNKTIDYARIAVILACIKLTVTTKNLATTEIEGKNQLYDENDSLLRYVERLLDFSKYLVKVNLPCLQTVLLLFHIKRVSPTESDGAGDGSNSIVAFKSALSMAVILGLNRNIEQLYAHESPAVIRLYQNIWAIILSCDACLSFAQGIPLGIEDEFINYDALDLNHPWIQLSIGIRGASRLLNQTRDCTVGEVLEVINKLEAFENKVSLSQIVIGFKNVDDFINSFGTVDYIEQRLLSSYALHVLYEMLYLSFDSGDHSREVYYNGLMKYGSLTVTHLIELLSRLTTRLLDSSPNLTPETYKSKLYNIVEISSSFTSLSRIVFLKTFVTLCYNVLERLKSSPPADNEIFESISKLKVSDFENFDIKKTSTSLAKVLRSPSVLHGLLGLICKHLLFLHNESFGKVYGFNFCLYAIIALFKYFNNLLTKILTKDQLELTINKPAPSIAYGERICPPSQTDNNIELKNLHEQKSANINQNELTPNNGNTNNSFNSTPNLTTNNPIPQTPNNNWTFLNPNYNNGFLNLSSSNSSNVPLNMPDDMTTATTSSIPSTSSAGSTGSTPISLNRYDFFEWKNKPVDDLFQNILMNDSIFTLDNASQSFSWLTASDAQNLQNIPSNNGLQNIPQNMQQNIPQDIPMPQNMPPNMPPNNQYPNNRG